MISFKKLGEALEINPVTVQRRLNALHLKNIVTGVQGFPKYAKLGLEHSFFLLQIQSVENMAKIEKFCDEHPYTRFRNRIFGTVNGQFVQFTSPIGTKDKIKESIEILVQKSIIERVITSYKPLSTISSTLKAQYWDIQTMQTDFQFSNWFRELEEMPPTDEEFPLNEYFTPDLEFLDVIILRELTRNARRSTVDLYRDIRKNQEYTLETPLTEYQVRKHRKKVEEKFIRNYRVGYNRRNFGLLNYLLYSGTLELVEMKKLYFLLPSIPFPSQLTLVERNPEKARYLWWINLPPLQTGSLTNYLFERSTEFQFMMFYGETSALYFLWHENWDQKQQKWKESREWMVTDPLKRIGIL